MNYMIELKVQNYADREKIIVALVNSGYSVKVVERAHPIKYLQPEHFVQVLEDVSIPNVTIVTPSPTDASALAEAMRKEMQQMGTGYTTGTKM
jgi:hypothetical protein